MRYQKHELLSFIGKQQKLLEEKTIVIVGLGATGSTSANLLARAGINLILVDRDVVELSNLQRQTIFDELDIGHPKAIVAKEKLSKVNSSIKIKAYVIDLNFSNINILFQADLILDCTDNMETRFLINDFAISNEIPWIYSAVLGVNAMSMNIVPGKTPCFRCIFKEPESIIENCESAGVLNSITNLISSIQATEAIKILSNQEFSKDIFIFDIWNLQMNKLVINKNRDCPACSKNNYEYLNGYKFTGILKFCGQNSFQIIGKPLNLNDLYKRLSKSTEAKINKYCIYTETFTAFSDGRVLIKADSVNKAKSIYSRLIAN